MKLLKLLNNNIFIITSCCLLGFWLGYRYRFDNIWDLLNYHYYNAFAFMHNRLNYDVVLGSINSFFNPLIDLPLYFMIHWWNDYPGLIYGVQGLYYGVCLFFFCKICALFVEKNSWQGQAIILLSAAVATTGSTVWLQVGSSTNEIQVSVPVLGGLYLWLRQMLQPQNQKGSLFLLAGLLLGAALGLKPTVITYCLSSGLCTIIFYKKLRNPLRFITMFALGGLLGYLLTNGWQMLRYWEWYGNPFFPFANEVFKSEYFDDINYRDTRYLPTFSTFFIYPFIWYSEDLYGIYECALYDYRLTVFYVLIICILLVSIFSKRVREFFSANPQWQVYFTFLGVSFFLWMGIFSILRYAVPIEMLGAVAISYVTVKFVTAWLLDTLGKHKYWKECLACLLICLNVVFLASPRVIEISAQNMTDKFLDIEHFKFPENSIIRAYGMPISLIFAVWAEENNIRGLGFNHNYIKEAVAEMDFVERGAFRRKRDEILAAYDGPEILLYIPYVPSPRFKRPHMDYIKKIEKEIEEKKLYCRPVRGSIADKQISVCVPPELKTQILGDE